MNKKIKPIAMAAASLALAALVLVGCSSGGGSTSSANSASSGSAGSSTAMTLTVGFDSAYPPYGFVGDDGQYTGFDLDLAAEVCERNGWDFKAEPIDWDAKDVLLGSGSISCIWNGFTLEGREGDYTFSDPYMLNEQVVVVKAGSDIATLEGLAGKMVMTQVDSAALDVLEKEAAEGGRADLAATFGSLATIGDYNNAFLQLDSGAVDAIACDLSIAQYQISKNPGKYVQLEEPLSSEHYAVGFKVGDTELASQVTAMLKEMYALTRSEERRVGKECRSRWSPYH